jgi:FkbM family methyltransferase
MELKAVGTTVLRRWVDAAALSVPGVARGLLTMKLRAAKRELWETRLVCDLPRGRTAVDVGAHIGLFTAPLAERHDRVIALEPNRDAARRLMSIADSNAVVLTAAGGNRSGVETLYVPVRSGRAVSALSSLASDGRDSAKDRALPTVVLAIDQLDLADVDFLKIDVEGFEPEVLAGAAGTIERCAPVILIEAEERHRSGAPTTIADQLLAAGYAGFFVYDGLVLDVQDFDPAKHQRVDDIPQVTQLGSGRYANNFLYVPSRSSREWFARLSTAVDVLAE